MGFRLLTGFGGVRVLEGYGGFRDLECLEAL